MDLELSGKTIIVTGGTDGLGFATVKSLLAEGANVLVTGRTQEKFARGRMQRKGPWMVEPSKGL